jgi:hypothetical protein
MANAVVNNQPMLLIRIRDSNATLLPGGVEETVQIRHALFAVVGKKTYEILRTEKCWGFCLVLGVSF